MLKNIFGLNKGRLMGDEIYIMLTEYGVSDKHFDIYCEFIRKRDYPTEEEIKEQKIIQEEIKEQTNIRNKKYEEEQKIINQYKASSRLEKLKAINNVC